MDTGRDKLNFLLAFVLRRQQKDEGRRCHYFARGDVSFLTIRALERLKSKKSSSRENARARPRSRVRSHGSQRSGPKY